MLERNILKNSNADTAPEHAPEYSGGGFVPLSSLTANTAKKRLDLAAVREKLARKSGSEYWRSLEEVCETDEFSHYLSREFPNQAPRDMAPLARRDFMKLMGASLILAGVGGCAFQPAEHIVQYVKAPEDMTPGIPLYYSTAMTLGGYAIPLMAESNMGRPTKLEGNPEHPASLGRTSAIAQAAILSLYDPDRSQNSRSGGDVANWDQFVGALTGLMNAQNASRGAGLRVLSETVSSPTFIALMNRVKARFPQMQWIQYEPVNRDNARAGALLAFGRDVQPHYNFAAARVVVSLDSDFLLEEANAVKHSRDFIQARKPQNGQMNRLYAAHSTPSNTAAFADHKLPMKARDIEALARVLSERLGIGGVTGDGKVGGNAQASAKWIDALVADLQANRGAGLIVAGAHQPAVVHALAHALNDALGNVGKTVNYSAPVTAPQTASQLDDLKRLTADMQAGRVQTLLIFGSNAAYTAPADVKFGEALKRVPNSIHLGAYDDETGTLCQWHIPETHFLESWGDARSYDGTATIQQPLIAPLYEAAHSPLEVLNVMAGGGDVRSRELVRNYWMAQQGFAGATPSTQNGAQANGTGANGAAGQMSTQSAQSVRAEQAWQKIVHDGFIPNTAVRPQPLRVAGGVGGKLPAPRNAGGMEIVFRADPTIYDGRFANNGWLQELPKPLTKLTWDNAALMSLATAQKLGVSFRDGVHDEVQLTHKGQSVKAAAFILPGHPDDSITVHLGYGRTRSGKTGTGPGFNAYALRQSAAPSFDTGVDVVKTGKLVKLAVTAHHNLINNNSTAIDGTHGRDIIRVGTFDDLQKKVLPVAPLDKRGLPIPLGAKPQFPVHEEKGGHGGASTHGSSSTQERTLEDKMEPNGFPSLYPQEVDITQRHRDVESGGNEKRPYAWGMAIDLTSCIGCNACVIGCQSENNVAIVGKDQVLMNRQMNWIRIDTYYKGDVESPEAHFQPVTCMHCEKAPCEPVCPVNATMHSPEGINEQIYNRCVGTKYCSNNCPYKVRRFNFLQYSDQDTPQIQLMANPDVTVRSRGVMEKCNYCIQRVQAAKIQAEKENRPIRDGDIVTACQQTCPTDAIVFGDINDPNSRVRKIKDGQLDYGLLTELNTVPRTSYQAKIVNPNAAITTSQQVSMRGDHSTTAQGGEGAADDPHKPPAAHTEGH